MVRIVLLYILVLIGNVAKCQNFCADSSTYIQYKSLLNDSLRIQKTILTRDGSTIRMGYFLNGEKRDKPFILKTTSNGMVGWCRKITTSVQGFEYLSFENVEEASNGNIFLMLRSSIRSSSPFRFLILSPTGNIIHQDKIGFSNIPMTIGVGEVTPLVSRFGQDSMLLVFSYNGPLSERQWLTLCTISNSGQIGQAVTYYPPTGTAYGLSYTQATIKGRVIKLHGTSLFLNKCILTNLSPATNFSSLEIDWDTKLVNSKKAYCVPPVFETIYGGGETYNTRAFILKNDNIIMARRLSIIEREDTDGLAELFSISKFDNQFNHINSKYICIPWAYNIHELTDYSIFIDSGGKEHLLIQSVENNEVLYAVKDINNPYYLQRKIAEAGTNEYIFEDGSRVAEPGFFSTFDFVSTNLQQSTIHNFKIQAKDTALLCFGTAVDYISTKPATVTPINWQGNFTIETATVENDTYNFSIEYYPMTMSVICNIVNKCDTLKLNAPGLVCDINQPVIITAYKNPLCNGKINFRFDTAAVQSYTQVNDTTLSLSFNKSYRGKIFARPSTCDKLIDSVEIVVTAPHQPINLGNDTTYCPGHSYLLNAQNTAFNSYVWQDGSANSSFTAKYPGKYYVSATDDCGRVYTDTINIIDKNIGLKIEKDTTICLSESVVLQATANFINYTWMPQGAITFITNNRISVEPHVTTSYSVRAEKFTGCFLSDTVLVKVENCPQYIYFPNSFTPNNDNLNDNFKPLIGGAIKKYELSIYNRWGNLVFKTTSKEQGWNGFYKGILQETGSFVWVCNYQFYNKPEMQKKGSLVLIK